MANISVPALGTKPCVIEKREPGKAIANVIATIELGLGQDEDMERGRKDIHSDALKARRMLHALRRPLQAVAQMDILSVATKALGCGQYNNILIHSTFGTPNRRVAGGGWQVVRPHPRTQNLSHGKHCHPYPTPCGMSWGVANIGLGPPPTNTHADGVAQLCFQMYMHTTLPYTQPK